MNFNRFDFGGLFDIELALENLPFLLGGLPMTLAVSLIGMLIGLILGLFLALLRGSNKLMLQGPARIYIYPLCVEHPCLYFYLFYTLGYLKLV